MRKYELHDDGTQSSPTENSSEHLNILKALAEGISPITGKTLPDESPYQHAKVLRALQAAIQILENQQKRKRFLPANAGKAWTAEEQKELIKNFEAGNTIAELAKKYQRTKGSIESRLIHAGVLTNHLTPRCDQGESE